MRLATVEHNIDEALKVMKPMASKSPIASLAIPLLMICGGLYYTAMREIGDFGGALEISKQPS